MEFINSNYSKLLQARVSQNPDGTYSLMLMPVDISKDIAVLDISGGTLMWVRQIFILPMCYKRSKGFETSLALRFILMILTSCSCKEPLIEFLIEGLR